ncbi:MAG: DUF393 domain-containing protein [Gemmatimonadota bacterium]|nr:DUF393 domain-containing protein [Gemmatimonadota bacterium]MDH4349689.1 DUF393 domain-containing protein [Gemmatimonadota bacterium]MDH5196866.1 DUF393 domain-containing protein [Gemmatimonadota bacterium]
MPTPRSQPLVVYDASCGFCRRWVRRLRWWDRANRLEFLPLQDERAPALTGVGRTALAQAAHVVLPSGDVHAGAAAFRALCPFLPGGRALHWLLGLPGVPSVTTCLYRWVARHWGPVGARDRYR